MRLKLEPQQARRIIARFLPSITFHGPVAAWMEAERISVRLEQVRRPVERDIEGNEIRFIDHFLVFNSDRAAMAFKLRWL